MNIRRSGSDAHWVLTQVKKGLLFSSGTKIRVIFEDEMDCDALQLLIDNYKPWIQAMPPKKQPAEAPKFSMEREERILEVQEVFESIY
jgi:hypothetical protein